MRNITMNVILMCALLFSITTVRGQNADVKGSKDHPLVTRLPDFYIGQYEENEYAQEDFKTEAGTVPVEGHEYKIDYRLKEGVTPTGKIQILRNYENALKGIGAEVMLKGSYYYIFKIAKDGKETWVKVDPGNYDGKRYELTIVDRTVMKQEVFADAAAMKNGILNNGRMAVYGIYFDSGKAVVKEGSEKTLNEIATLLKNNSSLNLFIVGHTDSDGNLAMNMDLSQKRAEAVVNILTEQYNIAKNRLEPKGLGPLAPVSTNRTAEGKAKNRRVELVEKLN
jgi:OmpA-OmpF porin, OOP family